MCSPWQLAPSLAHSKHEASVASLITKCTQADLPQLGVDVVQVPLEGLAAQLFPELQSALNTGGKEDTFIPGCRVAYTG